MNAVKASFRDEIIEITNRLFIYTDDRNWEGLQQEVFTAKVWFDMSSLGAGEASERSAAAICADWQKGFENIDAVHHQAGNYLVTAEEDGVNVFCYAIALHYRKDAVKGCTREFIGSYDLKLNETPAGWRIYSFRYLVKFIKGNAELE